MINPLKLIFLLLPFAWVNCYSQSLPVPRNIQAAYNNGTRSTNGAPGKMYWQNTADYTIKIDFNPATLLLKGNITIDYVNNSPDTLKQINFKLYPNLYKKGSIRNMEVSPADITDGVTVQRLAVNKQNQDTSAWKVDGTEMQVQIQPLASGQHIQFNIDYAYKINKTSHIRTGMVDSGAFFIAYFFPRIAVYDDIDGWNRNHYQGIQEFYNDFCHYNTEITVPGNYEVWATGNLINADDVYNDKIAKRLNDALKSDSVTDVISEADVKAGNITRNRTSNTWKFDADSVTDFAFAISNHYLWKAAGLTADPKTGRRVRVDAVFNPAHKGYFEVINYARKTVAAMSYTFPAWPYPFPHETVFDGLDQMEYPMMVNDAPYEKREDDIELTDHEIFHSMFPFYMGINETKYAWMDEGWATIGEWQISHIIDPTITDLYAINDYANNAGKESDLPIMTLSTQEDGITYQTDSYPKPALGYLYLKDLLGDELFTKAMHYYISQWHGKHPMPFDFFNSINTASGMNLNWFWKSWFFDGGVPDLAIGSVKNIKSIYTIDVLNNGTKPIPVDLTIFYRNGGTETIHRNIECWKDGAKNVIIHFAAKSKVQRIVLGNGYDPDINKADNEWAAR